MKNSEAHEMILNVLYNPPVKFTVDVELMKLARIDIKFKRHTPYLATAWHVWSLKSVENVLQN